MDELPDDVRDPWDTADRHELIAKWQGEAIRDRGMADTRELVRFVLAGYASVVLESPA